MDDIKDFEIILCIVRKQFDFFHNETNIIKIHYYFSIL